MPARQIWTVTGRPNTVVGVAGDDVLVATGRSPAGQPVPVGSVQSGLDRLLEAGEIEVSTASLGHRSSFIGAVLRTLAGTVVIPATPPGSGSPIRPPAIGSARQAPLVSAWWAGDARQRFWLEITDRPDIGVDLHCPQRDATGSRTPGYSLIWSVEPGDVIFHYSLQKRAIIAWSRAAGQVTEAPTVWLSHRGATRGFRHVIATMWTVDDSPTAQIVDCVYADLVHGKDPDPERAAHALHHAVRELRRVHPANPLLWAPYIHLGA